MNTSKSIQVLALTALLFGFGATMSQAARANDVDGSEEMLEKPGGEPSILARSSIDGSNHYSDSIFGPLPKSFDPDDYEDMPLPVISEETDLRLHGTAMVDADRVVVHDLGASGFATDHVIERTTKSTPSETEDLSSTRTVDQTSLAEELSAPLPSKIGEPGEPGVSRMDSLSPVPGWEWPWIMNARIFTTWPDGTRSACSAGMIGRTHVLSAGHCIYSHEHGGWARDVLVIPGMHGDYCPVGGAWAKKLSSWRGWTQNGNHDWDMGVIELDRPSGDWSGYFGLATSSCSASINNIRNNTSYPPIAPFNGVTLAHRAGTADSCPNSNILWFNNPSYGGMSGSPVYRYDGEDRFVIGVLSYTTHGGQVTGVVRVTTDRFYSILDIMGR